MKVNGLSPGHVGEKLFSRIGIVEDVVDEDLADDENRDDHRDVPLPHLHFLFKQSWVVFELLHFMGHLELAIEANNIGKLRLFEVDEELRGYAKFSKCYHAKEVVHLDRHSIRLFSERKQQELEPD